MACFRTVGMALALLASASASRSEGIKTDLYGDPLPPGAVARLGTIRLRHAHADVAFTKDGKQLISCGCDGGIRVWDVVSGRMIRRKRLTWKPQSEKRIETAFLSPDGSTAAVDDLDSIHLFDTKTGKERGHLPIDIHMPQLVFSHGCKLMAVHGWDNNHRHFTELWDIDRFTREEILEMHADTFLGKIAFSPEGKHIAGIAMGDHAIHLWDAKTGKWINKIDRVKLLGASVAFSPDGKTLAVGSLRKGEVRLIDVAARKEKAVLKSPATVKSDSIDQLAFSPDGRLLAAAYAQDAFPPTAEHGVLIWDVAGEKLTRRIPERQDVRLLFAPDGKTLACHDEYETEIRLWDVASGRRLHRWRAHGGSVESLTGSADGKLLASTDRVGRLCLWNLATNKPLHVLPAWYDWNWLRGHNCHFSPDGKQIITASCRGTIQVWDVAAGKELRRWQMALPEPGLGLIDASGLSADGNRLTAIGWVGDAQSAQVFVWDVATGKELRSRSYHREMRNRFSLSEKIPSLAYISDVAVAPDGETATVWMGERVGLEDLATGGRLALFPNDVGGPIVFSPDGRLLAAAVLLPRKDPLEAIDQGEEVIGLSLIETATGEESVRLKTAAFHFVAFAPDNRGIIVADKQALRVLDADTGERLYRMPWPDGVVDVYGEAKIHSLLPLPGGRLATGMADGDILIWDLAASTWPTHPNKGNLDHKQLDALWSDLAGSASKAHRAISQLAAAPRQTLPFLRNRLHPVTLDTKRIEKLLMDLDSDSFSAREAATRKLTRLRYRVRPMLRRALESHPSLEMRRRIESILTGEKRPPSEALRTMRAIAVLERIGTPEARSILEKLSGGAAARETSEARAALQRLKRR